MWHGCELSGEQIRQYRVGVEVAWLGFTSAASLLACAFAGNVTFEIHCNKLLDAAARGTKRNVGATGLDLLLPGMRARRHRPSLEQLPGKALAPDAWTV